MPVADVRGDCDDRSGSQADGLFALFAVPALARSADEHLTAAGFRVVDMPVVAASRLKGHVRKEQTAFLVSQGIEKRFADKILRVCGVFAAFSEYILLFKFFLCHDIFLTFR